MGNQYAKLMREGVKLPKEAKPEIGPGSGPRLAAYVKTQEDTERVRVLAGNGVAQDVISKVLGIAKMTLTKYYAEELEDGRALVTAHMGAALVREGMAGNVAAQRYWLGTHGGQEWRIPKESALMPDVFDSEAERNERVHFFLPPNGRDQPETLDEPPVIEGEAEEAA